MDVRQTGRFIAQLRKERGLTQQDLAEQLNVTDKAVSRWETGRGLPDADSLLRLSLFFNVTINELLMGRRSAKAERTKEEEARVAADFLKTSDKQKKYRIGLTVICTLAALSIILSGIFYVRLYRSAMGSPDCTIAEDYASLTLFGKNICHSIPGMPGVYRAWSWCRRRRLKMHRF